VAFKNRLSEVDKEFHKELLEFYDLLPTYLWMEPDQESTWRGRFICDAMALLFEIGGLNRMQIPEMEKSKVKKVRSLYQKNHGAYHGHAQLSPDELFKKLTSTECYRKLDKKIQHEMHKETRMDSDFKKG